MIGTMASKKKRLLAVEPEVRESACKKVRLNDGAIFALFIILKCIYCVKQC